MEQDILYWLCTDSEKACNAVWGDVLYNILTEYFIHVKLVRLIKNL